MGVVHFCVVTVITVPLLFMHIHKAWAMGIIIL